MPNIQVTCPECKSVLEIGAEFAGQEIECGSCLHVFVAEPPPARPDSAGRSGLGSRRRNEEVPEDRERSRSSRSSRRQDEDDYDRRPTRRRRDEDDEDGYEPRRPSTGPGAASIFAFVLGLLSSLAIPVTCCGCCSMLTWPITVPLGIAAIITGAFGLKDPKGKPLAIIGIIFGAVALACVFLQLVIGFGPLMVPPGAR
ncbi:DUF4190 domain-containing protein [Gemmata sp. G18]|uniref:DUF4190 domain-containing protein n=1 Tax=Gemmata palustris TaxID=2822762 RepID=A0ABS5BSE8_9BACT|nr:DUF4190 domain-containing protein [Gemmata palustris]MBP3956672.1 DUF4190 domain-containing protein [Gemmata palustris]